MAAAPPPSSRPVGELTTRPPSALRRLVACAGLLGAVLALSGCGEGAPVPAPDPAGDLRALADANPRVRAKAAAGLAGVEEARVTAALVGALRDPDRWVREAAVLALAPRAPRQPSAVVPALVEALRDADDYVRYRAAKALAEVGPPASAALPRLEEMARDDVTEIGGWWAREAIRRIRGK